MKIRCPIPWAESPRIGTKKKVPAEVAAHTNVAVRIGDHAGSRPKRRVRVNIPATKEANPRIETSV